MRIVRWLHRTLGLALATLWLLQALSGVILVFGRDLGHLSAAAEPAAFEVDAWAAGIARIEAQGDGRRITSVLSAEPRGRWFDVLSVDDQGSEHFARMDGQGTVVDQSRGFFLATLDFHQALLNDGIGDTLIGISGIFLLLTLVLGATLAWPRQGRWRVALVPTRQRRAWITLQSFHRALGLWLAIPLFALALAGVLLAIGEPLRAAAGGTIEEPRLAPAAPAELAVTVAQAVRTATQQFPNARLSIVKFPSAQAPWYRVRLRQAGEIRRLYGTTAVWIDARTGAVLQIHDALRAPAAVTAFDGVYPLHTGELAGWGGRILVLLFGLSFASLIVLGASAWWRRRSPANGS